MIKANCGDKSNCGYDVQMMLLNVSGNGDTNHGDIKLAKLYL